MKMRLQLASLLILLLGCNVNNAYDESQGAYGQNICSDPVCTFDWNVQHQKSMTYTVTSASGKLTTYDVVLSGSNLVTVSNTYHSASDHNVGLVVSPDNVITVDGFSPRYVITVNGQFLAPTIEVMQNSEVVIIVRNNLYLEATTIHWHGVLQQGTPWADGPSYVTQCPIIPREVFTYRFWAYDAGTQFYHAHFYNQRSDGLTGLIIVHAVAPPIPYFNVVLQDWDHRDGVSAETEDPAYASNPGPGNGFTLNPASISADGNTLSIDLIDSVLINGKGRWNGNLAPLTVFNVTQQQQYRFRVVNAGLAYGLQLSIDSHMLEIVATDGHEIDPILVNSFIAFPGERVDFTIYANQPVGSYWIRTSTLATNVVLPQGRAILHYSGAPNGDPTTNATNCKAQPTGYCVVFNCINEAPETANYVCVMVDEVKTPSKYLSQDYYEDHGLDQYTPDLELFLNFGLKFGPSINGISNVKSRSMLLGQDLTNNPYIVPCNSSCGTTIPCTCTNIISLPYMAAVQLVFTNYVATGGASPHAVHLHGHSYAVLHVGHQSINATTGLANGRNPDVTCADPLCITTKWTNDRPWFDTSDPSLKDTIVLPPFGYVVVRIRANNPGVWFMHCHLESHVEHGMALAFNEAQSEQPPLPTGFPTCGDFL